jgi:hypothetical protein
LGVLLSAVECTMHNATDIDESKVPKRFIISNSQFRTKIK